MKKVFRITTKNNAWIQNTNCYDVFAETLSEAVSKVDNVIKIANVKEERITKAELFCEVEEDSDLQEFTKERIEEEKAENEEL